MTNRQKWTVTLVPAVLLAAIVLPIALASSDLPDSIATHWGFGGSPNGHMSPSVLVLLVGGIFVAVWLGVWGASRRMPFEARSFIAGLAGIGGLLVAVQWIAVDLNRGVADWVDAGAFNVLHLVLVFAAAWSWVSSAGCWRAPQSPSRKMQLTEPARCFIWSQVPARCGRVVAAGRS